MHASVALKVENLNLNLKEQVFSMYCTQYTRVFFCLDFSVEEST